MRKSLFIFVILLMVSCKNAEAQKESIYPASITETKQAPEELGQEIFQGKGNCIACHQVNSQSIGPSVHEIAKIYRDNNASIVAFLKEDGEPIVDPSQYEVMKTNFAITKEMSDEELKAVETYFNSTLK